VGSVDGCDAGKGSLYDEKKNESRDHKRVPKKNKLKSQKGNIVAVGREMNDSKFLSLMVATKQSISA
jgi:co-chaperonin GroES (HSP10)